jgi:hypothetical protein
MTKEELDRARAKEAERILGKDHPKLVAQLAACLAREGWTPPVVVDPDLAEDEVVLDNFQGPYHGKYVALAGIKRGRELERAALHIPIAEQNQKVIPEPVDPDLAEADDFYEAYQAIKRGRALAAAEAKNLTIPGVAGHTDRNGNTSKIAVIVKSKDGGLSWTAMPCTEATQPEEK